MATTTIDKTPARPRTAAAPGPRGRTRSPYPYWFYLPAAVIYGVLFVIPTVTAF